MSLPLPDRGILRVSIEDPGGYPADDERFLVLDPTRKPRVVIVTGDGPAAASPLYVEAALAAVNREEFEVVTWSPRRSPEAKPWDGSAAVLLLGTYGVERAALDAIGRANAAGAGLLVAAGPGLEVSRLEGVLPWLGGKESSTAAEALSLAPTDIRHPAFRALDGNAGWLSTVRFDRALDLGDAGGGHVLARFSNGATALVERDGTARLLVLASDLSNTWNDLALHPVFVPFVHGLVQYAAASGAPPRELRVGERPGLTRPGVTEDRRARVAVNVDSAEADRARLTPAAFVAAAPRAGGEAAQPRQSVSADREREQSLWRYGLMLMLVALVVESAVGRRA